MCGNMQSFFFCLFCGLGQFVRTSDLVLRHFERFVKSRPGAERCVKTLVQGILTYGVQLAFLLVCSACSGGVYVAIYVAIRDFTTLFDCYGVRAAGGRIRRLRLLSKTGSQQQ